MCDHSIVQPCAYYSSACLSMPLFLCKISLFYYVLSLLPQGEYTEANEMFARVAGALEKYHGGDDLELAHTLHFRARALIFQVLLSHWLYISK